MARPLAGATPARHQPFVPLPTERASRALCSPTTSGPPVARTSRNRLRGVAGRGARDRSGWGDGGPPARLPGHRRRLHELVRQLRHGRPRRDVVHRPRQPRPRRRLRLRTDRRRRPGPRAAGGDGVGARALRHRTGPHRRRRAHARHARSDGGDLPAPGCSTSTRCHSRRCPGSVARKPRCSSARAPSRPTRSPACTSWRRTMLTAEAPRRLGPASGGRSHCGWPTARAHRSAALRSRLPRPGPSSTRRPRRPTRPVLRPSGSPPPTVENRFDAADCAARPRPPRVRVDVAARPACGPSGHRARRGHHRLHEHADDDHHDVRRPPRRPRSRRPPRRPRADHHDDGRPYDDDHARCRRRTTTTTRPAHDDDPAAHHDNDADHDDTTPPPHDHGRTHHDHRRADHDPPPPPPPTPSPPPRLPRTGRPLASLGLIGSGLVLVGGGLVGVRPGAVGRAPGDR